MLVKNKGIESEGYKIYRNGGRRKKNASFMIRDKLHNSGTLGFNL